MAFAQEGNVLRFDADNQTFDNKAKLKIVGVLLVGGVDASTAQIVDESDAGTILYECRAAISSNTYEQVHIRVDKKIHVNLTGTAPILYVYLE